MEFAFTEEQQMIRDTAEAFLGEVSDSAAVRCAMATDTGFEEAIWQRVCTEMYWQAIHIPEAYGGLGLGFVELVAVLEQMGRFLFCSPYFATVGLGVNALLVAGTEQQKLQHLAAIIEGSLTATLGYSGGGRSWNCDAVTATFEPAGDGFRLNGTLRYVPDGHTAGLVIIAARRPGSTGSEGIGLFALDADSNGVTRRWTPTMDQTRKQAEIILDGVEVPVAAAMGEPGERGADLAKIIELALACTAADQLGGASQALDLSVDYLSERYQFNRPIASFQAIKHKAADMMLKAEVARSAVYYVACVAQEALFGDGEIAAELSEAASMAKAHCSDTYFFNAGCSLQMHGGVGFTWEYDIHLYFKRAQSTETYLGDGTAHRERVAALLLDRGRTS